MNDKTLKIKTRTTNNCWYIETDEYFLVHIRELIKQNFYGKVYNLEVDEDNSFIANNLTVHNCMPHSTVEMLLDSLSKKLNLPVYHFSIDEEVFKTGIEMRIKSYARILERNKNEISHRI